MLEYFINHPTQGFAVAALIIAMFLGVAKDFYDVVIKGR